LNKVDYFVELTPTMMTTEFSLMMFKRSLLRNRLSPREITASRLDFISAPQTFDPSSPFSSLDSHDVAELCAAKVPVLLLRLATFFLLAGDSDEGTAFVNGEGNVNTWCWIFHGNYGF
jgi:hypothetical protein